MVTIMLARSLRYYVEGALAGYYGEVIEFLRTTVIILSVAAGLVIVGVAVYMAVKHIKRRAERGRGSQRRSDSRKTVTVTSDK